MPDIVPAFIDSPGVYAPLADWLEYRADLDALPSSPALDRLKRQADTEIARLLPT